MVWASGMAKSAQKIVGLIRMSRPAFLVGGFAFFALGAALAWARGATLDAAVLVVGQLAISAIQLTTHYSNEYFDFEGDLTNPNPTRWAGGSRVLPEGGLPRWSALVAAVVCSVGALAAIMVLWLGFETGAAAAPLLFAALVLGWGYSAPPLRLEYIGLGEVNVAVVVSALTPLTAYVLLAGQLDLEAFIALLPLCLLQVAVSMAANFADAEGDRLAYKRTLVVRLGEGRAGRLYAGLLLATFAALPLQLLVGLPVVVPLAVATSAPLGFWLAARMGRGTWAGSDRWDRLVFWSSGLSMAIVGLMTGALALTAWLENTH